MKTVKHTLKWFALKLIVMISGIDMNSPEQITIIAQYKRENDANVGHPRPEAKVLATNSQEQLAVSKAVGNVCVEKGHVIPRMNVWKMEFITRTGAYESTQKYKCNLSKTGFPINIFANK